MPPDAPTSIEAIQLDQLIARAGALLIRLEQQLDRGDAQLARIDAFLGQVSYLDGGIQQIGELDRKEMAALDRQSAALEQLATEIREMRQTSDKVLDLSVAGATLNWVQRLVKV